MGLQPVQLVPGSEDRQRIKRRTRSQGDPQRGSREQKLIAIQLPRMLDGSLEIQIIENAHAHRYERQAMKRVCDRRRKARGRDVIRSVASDERNAAFFYEIRNIGVIARESRGVRPGTHGGAALPSPLCARSENLSRRQARAIS